MKKSVLVSAIILALCISSCSQIEKNMPQQSTTTSESSISVLSDASSENELQSSGNSSIMKDESSSEKQNSLEGNGAQPSQTDTQTKGTTVFDLFNGDGTSITESSSFMAKNGDVLTIEITSNISGGQVDLFLFSPDKVEQKISIVNAIESKTIELSDGEWAYNCTGFFDSGSIKIVGIIA